MPKFLIDKEIGNNEISRLIEVADMSERIQVMLKMSEGFIVLPGGFGTFEEFLKFYLGVKWDYIKANRVIKY